jgi:hypothetical protein
VRGRDGHRGRARPVAVVVRAELGDALQSADARDVRSPLAIETPLAAESIEYAEPAALVSAPERAERGAATGLAWRAGARARAGPALRRVLVFRVAAAEPGRKPEHAPPETAIAGAHAPAHRVARVGLEPTLYRRRAGAG